MEESDVQILFTFEEKENISVSAKLKDRIGKVFISNYQKEMLPYDSEKERFKQVKNAVAHVYLTVLQEWTIFQF